MAKKKKQNKFNNKYKISNDVAEEIRSLHTPDLIERVSIEYNNLNTSERLKKTDPAISSKKDSIKDLKEEIKGKLDSHPDIVALREQLEQKQEEILSSELSDIRESLETDAEELKNLNQPYNEDILRFRGMFSISLDEVSKRRELGALVFKMDKPAK